MDCCLRDASACGGDQEFASFIGAGGVVYEHCTEEEGTLRDRCQSVAQHLLGLS
jgi:hypothetical protein